MSAPASLAETLAVQSAAERAVSEPEFSFASADFERVRVLIRRRAGISLHAGKQAMVYSRLSRRLRVTGHRSFASYLKALESAPDGASEWQEFVNALTTNLTAFFREAHHFEALAHALASSTAPGLRIWCNAASTGEEPCSIAMVAAETLGPDAPVAIVATDIDTQVLETARRGVYPADARGLTPSRLASHFLRGKGANGGFVRIRPELARRIDYRVHNLMHSPVALGEPFDIVFCRNVMIYFDPPTQHQVLQHIHRAMKPGGLLFAGHSENLSYARELFRPCGKTIYART